MLRLNLLSVGCIMIAHATCTKTDFDTKFKKNDSLHEVAFFCQEINHDLLSQIKTNLSEKGAANLYHELMSPITKGIGLFETNWYFNTKEERDDAVEKILIKLNSCVKSANEKFAFCGTDAQSLLAEPLQKITKEFYETRSNRKNGCENLSITTRSMKDVSLWSIITALHGIKRLERPIGDGVMRISDSLRRHVRKCSDDLRSVCEKIWKLPRMSCTKQCLRYNKTLDDRVKAIVQTLGEIVNTAEKAEGFSFRTESELGFRHLVKRTVENTKYWNQNTLAKKQQLCHTMRFTKWQPNEDVTRCPGKCGGKQEFGSVINQRHHCRTCKRIFCGSCATRQTMLDAESRKCYKCIEYEGEEKVVEDNLVYSAADYPMGQDCLENTCFI